MSRGRDCIGRGRNLRSPRSLRKRCDATGLRPGSADRTRGSRDLSNEARARLVEPRARGVRLAATVEDDEDEVARFHVSRENSPARELEREIGDLAEARALGRAAQLSQPYGLVGSENFRRALPAHARDDLALRVDEGRAQGARSVEKALDRKSV